MINRKLRRFDVDKIKIKDMYRFTFHSLHRIIVNLSDFLTIL